MKKSIPNEWKSDLPEGQEDELLHKALRQKFDTELRQKWAGQLAQEGIRRKPEARIVPIAIGMGSRRMNWWAAAASALVLLGAAWWLFLKPSPSETTVLANQYFSEISRSATQTRMGEGDADAAWQTAQDHYAQGRFEDAVIVTSAISLFHPLDAYQHYFLALSHLQTKPPSFDIALEQLEAARRANLAEKTDAFREEIEWVHALALLKKGDAAAAERKLQEIAKAGGWFADKAQALLKKTGK